ncbi:hypothetical protein Cgig2_007476 [Carnegiea gigantea]|uniref:Uncharacterized protein n=1 Tax=Carnegiea gigantea TaxID=171969 RepID=A0A9Q1K6T2_9CARY|nr:hypothetical protein Cgig2_007476 [Carnegiea gigantea]
MDLAKRSGSTDKAAQLTCRNEGTYVVPRRGHNLHKRKLEHIQNLHNHRVERKPHAIVAGHLIDHDTLLGAAHLLWYLPQGLQNYIRQAEDTSSPGSFSSMKARHGAPGNLDPSATISRTGSIKVLPFLFSTNLPGMLGAPRDEELADALSEEELVDGSSEDKLTDVPIEKELELGGAEITFGSPFSQQLIRSLGLRSRLGLRHSSGLKISHKVSYSDFPWIRDLFLNTEDAESRGVLTTRP